MKISEMTLEQLQDYAVKLEEENKGLKAGAEEQKTKMDELTDLNRQLQKRNNDLFMKVEQGIVEAPQAPQPEEEKTESCEDFAKNLIKDGKI